MSDKKQMQIQEPASPSQNIFSKLAGIFSRKQTVQELKKQNTGSSNVLSPAKKKSIVLKQNTVNVKKGSISPNSRPSKQSVIPNIEQLLKEKRNNSQQPPDNSKLRERQETQELKLPLENYLSKQNRQFSSITAPQNTNNLIDRSMVGDSYNTINFKLQSEENLYQSIDSTNKNKLFLNLQSRKQFDGSLGQSPIGSIKMQQSHEKEHDESFSSQSLRSKRTYSQGLNPSTVLKQSQNDTQRTSQRNKQSFVQQKSQQSIPYQINIIPDENSGKDVKLSNRQKTQQIKKSSSAEFLDKSSVELQNVIKNMKYEGEQINGFQLNTSSDQVQHEMSSIDRDNNRKSVYMPALDSIDENSVEETKLELSRDVTQSQSNMMLGVEQQKSKRSSQQTPSFQNSLQIPGNHRFKKSLTPVEQTDKSDNLIIRQKSIPEVEVSLVDGSIVDYTIVGGKKKKKKKKSRKQGQLLPPTAPKMSSSFQGPIQRLQENNVIQTIKEDFNDISRQNFNLESTINSNGTFTQSPDKLHEHNSALQMLTQKIMQDLNNPQQNQQSANTNPQQLIQKRLLELLSQQKFQRALNDEKSTKNQEEQPIQNQQQDQQIQKKPSMLAEFLMQQKKKINLKGGSNNNNTTQEETSQIDGSQQRQGQPPDEHSLLARTLTNTMKKRFQQYQQQPQLEQEQQQQQNNLKINVENQVGNHRYFNNDSRQDSIGNNTFQNFSLPDISSVKNVKSRNQTLNGNYNTTSNAMNSSKLSLNNTSINQKAYNQQQQKQQNNWQQPFQDQQSQQSSTQHPWEYRTFTQAQMKNTKAFAFKPLDMIKRDIEREMSQFKKEIRQINLRCAAQGNDLIYQKQLLHKVKIELLDEREEEFKGLMRSFIELHEALDDRMRELQKQYDSHIDNTINQVENCMHQLDNLIIGLDEVQEKNKEFLLVDQTIEDDKEKIDFFLRQEYPVKFRDINQKMQMIKLAKFEFPSFEINTEKLKESISRIGAFKVNSIANVNYGVQRFYNYKDPQDSQMIFQFRWNTKDVYYFDSAINKWTLMQEFIPKEPFLYFSSVVFLPKQLGTFILGGLDSADHYSKRCLWFKKYRQFYEKCPMLQKRAFFSSVYSQIDCQIYVIGGYDGTNDLRHCEKYSLYENVWREITPLNIPRNGASTLLLKHLKFLFALGGNNKQDGSLDKIERYDLEFDTWNLIDLRLPIPMHDFQNIIIHNNQDQDEYKLLLFGGQTTNEQTINRAYLLDITLELNRNPESQINKKLGKIYYPISVIDQRRCYIFTGYSDELLKPYILDFKQFKLEKVRMQQLLNDKMGAGLIGKIENVLKSQKEPNEKQFQEDQINHLDKMKQYQEDDDYYYDANKQGGVYHTEQIKAPLGLVVDKMKSNAPSEANTEDFYNYKGYVIRKVAK